MDKKGVCNLCGKNGFELIKDFLRDDRTKFKVYKCLACGHIQILPKPTTEEDKAFYDKNMQDKGRGKEIDYEKLRKNNSFDTKRHVRLISEIFGKNSSILDIGSGYGFFVSALKDSGYNNVKGLEISEERRDISLKHSDVDILSNDVAEGPGSIGRYDVITLFHVLEHTADPVAFLKMIKKLLNPGGRFVCEVPNVKDALLDNSQEYNDFYWIRAHLNYFSEETLKMALERSGFKKPKFEFCQRYGLINLCNWLYTGKPQIERPVFDIPTDYDQAEKYYRKRLESQGRSDALIVVAKS